MKDKWAVVDISSSRGIKSDRRIVARFEKLFMCDLYIHDVKANNKRSYPTELAIREIK
jgi:hypothetical protein